MVTAYRAASTGLGAIPTQLSLPVARALFLSGYWAWPQKRRIVEANASRVLGLPPNDTRVRALARMIYATYSRSVVELMRLPSLPADAPRHLVRDEGDRSGGSFMELWERYRSQGRGIICASGHIGSIDIFAGAFAARGLPIFGLADDTAYPELFQLLNEQRARWGVGIVPWRNLREVYRVLRKPAALGLVVDWGYRSDGIPVRLFGRWTALPPGPAQLAARTNAAIIPVVNRRQTDGTYVAAHDEPIEVISSSPAELLRATQGVADALERMVADEPAQWFTFKPMWPATSHEERELAERASQMAGQSNSQAGDSQ